MARYRRCTVNPARDLKDALRRPEPQHFPAITDPKRFGELLRGCDAYAATPVIRGTGHGFRVTAGTMLHERLGSSPDVIEAQLARSVSDSLGLAYNRTEFVDQRRAMLQA